MKKESKMKAFNEKLLILFLCILFVYAFILQAQNRSYQNQIEIFSKLLKKCPSYDPPLSINPEYIRNPVDINFSWSGFSPYYLDNLESLAKHCQSLANQGSSFVIVSGNGVSQVTWGYSMFPTIIPQNSLIIEKYKQGRKLRVGDIVGVNFTNFTKINGTYLLINNSPVPFNNQLIIHRIIGINESNQSIITKGDNNRYKDPSSNFENISFIVIGVVYTNMTNENYG